MDRILYALPIPESAQIDTGTQLSKQISAQGSVGKGEGAVQSISLDPNQQKIQGSYRSQEVLGGLMARQMEELFQSGGIEYVPYFGREGADGIDGWYTLDNTDIGPADASTEAVQTYNGTVTKVGTKKDYVRAVRCAPTTVETVGASNYSADNQPEHTERIYLPTDAARVRWFSPVTKAVERAEPLNKWEYPEQAGELANYRAYSLDQASFYDSSEGAPTPPALLYELPYRREYQSDVRVWDTCPEIVGEEKIIPGDLPRGSEVGGPGATVGSATVGASPREGNVAVAQAWQRVFRSGHEFRGEAVLDNGVLRIRFDDERGALRAERSRGHFDAWADQPLRSSPWTAVDLDITHVGLARVEAQIAFERYDGVVHNLDVALPRGYKRAIWTTAQNETGETPPALAYKLAPIAMWGGVDVSIANQRADLVAREDIRR